MKKGILFDLDGTLWDSRKGVAASWNEKLESLDGVDYRVDEETFSSLMGKTMDEIAYAVFEKETKERALELINLCTEYENEYLEKHGGILYPDLEETLELLHKDYTLAVVSNCQVGYIEAFIKHHNLSKYFDDTENYGNTGYDKDVNIKLVVERNNLDKAVYVGDIMGDYNSTMKAGYPFIHAAYGFGEVPEGTPYVNSFRELPKVVKEVIG
ncbi:MAG: HAD family hydrolase [Lachnospiraceae bacterium]|nr:HAD family hydrolase [Lachnospiraceae bacterium]